MKILNYPHPALRFKTESLKTIDSSIKTCADDMIEIMKKENGIGLSANQVGLPFRMFVANWHDNYHCFLNPTIRAYGKVKSAYEGCLSFPGVQIKVRRASKCSFQAWALTGDDIDEEVTGDLCRLLQHEMDHLDGVLFTDRLSDIEFSTPRVKHNLIAMERAFSKYPKEFDTDTFHELRYQYCGIERPKEARV